MKVHLLLVLAFSVPFNAAAPTDILLGPHFSEPQEDVAKTSIEVINPGEESVVAAQVHPLQTAPVEFASEELVSETAAEIAPEKPVTVSPVDTENSPFPEEAIPQEISPAVIEASQKGPVIDAHADLDLEEPASEALLEVAIEEPVLIGPKDVASVESHTTGPEASIETAPENMFLVAVEATQEGSLETAQIEPDLGESISEPVPEVAQVELVDIAPVEDHIKVATEDPALIREDVLMYSVPVVPAKSASEIQALADLAPEELASIAPDKDTPEEPALAMESMVLVIAAAEEPAHNDTAEVTAEEEPESVSVIAKFIPKDTGIHLTERTTPSAPVETAEEELGIEESALIAPVETSDEEVVSEEIVSVAQQAPLDETIVEEAETEVDFSVGSVEMAEKETNPEETVLLVSTENRLENSTEASLSLKESEGEESPVAFTEVPEDLFVPTETPSAEPVIMPVPNCKCPEIQCPLRSDEVVIQVAEEPDDNESDGDDLEVTSLATDFGDVTSFAMDMGATVTILKEQPSGGVSRGLLLGTAFFSVLALIALGSASRKIH